MSRARDMARTVKPGFLATLTGNTGIGSGGGVLPFNSVTFDARCFNNGGHYNTSNYRFTAPVSGKYLFAVNINVYNATGVTFTSGIMIDGTSSIYGTRFATNISGDNNSSMSTIVHLNAGQYVQGVVALTSAMTLSGGTTWNSFSGMLVSD